MITKSEISRIASLILFLFCLNASAQSLKIVAVEPLPNRVNVTRDADIRLEFNKAVSSSWIHSNSLIVFGEKSGQIKGDISFSENHFAAIFHPQRPFIVGDRITVVLVRQPNLPEDLLKKGYIWEFNIAPETGGKEYFSLQFDASMRLTSLSAADFDQDGCVDLAMAGSIDDKEFLRLAFYQNGQLHFRDPVQVPDRVRPFYCGDLNRDGFPDFVLVHRGRQKFSIEPRISIYYLSADGNLVAGQTIDLAFSRLGVAEPRAAAINDFNGDGYLDIIVMTLNSTRKSALVYLNDGTGKFPEDDDKIEWFDNSSTAQSIFARDLNNSGFIDIGIGHSGGLNASVNLYLNNGTATFSNPLLGIRGGRDLEMSNAMDLNGDLIPDLLSADYDLHQLFVSFCEGIDGSKSPPSPIYQINSTKFNTVLHPNWMELGDLDADGDMDPVLTGSKQADIWIMWNEQGSFASSSQIAVSPQPTNFVIGDLNSDHSLDIVVADTTGLITVLFNNIDGFQAPYAPNLLQPADLALSNNHYPVFQWLTPADINPQDSLHFRLTIQDADGKRHVFDSMSQPALFSPTPPVIQGGGLITFTMPDSLPDHDYTWFVEAFDLLFWGQPSESWRFTIDSQPPAQVSIAFPDADYDGEWFAIQGDSLISAEVTYTELHPLQAEISTVGLGGPFYYNDLLGGNNVKQTLSFLPTHSADGKFPITVKIIDRMAQSGSVQDSVGVDRQPPSGATAFSDAPMSSSRQFRIHWRGGDDGNGSGLSGEYRIQYRVNGGPWIIWIDKTTARDSLFSGSQNQFYEFEAAAYDRVGFVEPFNGIAETSVLVNIYASDKTPPAAPTNLLANGANPSPWQSLSEFTIRWNTPKDESGIESSFWKLGSAPTSNNDYNQKSHPLNPVTVSVTTDGTVPFYVWLADSAGNVDYRNHATIDLRRDSVLPVVQTIAIDTPLPAFVQDNVIPWYNSQSMKSYTLSSTFVEKYPEQGVLTTDGLTDSLFNQGAALGSGEIKKTTFQFAIQNPADRIYTLKTAIIDSASNKGSKSLKIGMDGTAPFGSMAASPVVSATDTFTVRWSAGSDDNGSGIISYRIFSRTQTMPWVLWFEAPAAGKKAFTGQNGVTYYFESRAVDHVGLVEAAGASAETATRIDFSANDREAPPPPNNLRANGGAPASPWTANSAFIISWSNPQDASGIAGSLWKLGNAPVSNSDTSGIGGKGPANGPMTVTMNTTGKQWLYVWLIDGKGNVNYLNTARVQLRFDNQSPKFTQAFLHPGYGKDWFSPVQQSGIELQIIYQEQYPDSLSIRSDQLGFSLKTTELKSGNAVEYIAPFSIAGKPDGMALLYTSLCDSARNKTSFTDTIKIDSTPPIGASASSPQISGTASFVVNWSSGTDAGVGVADIFDLFVRVDQGQWNLWKSNFVGRSVTYTGENGKSYGFEVLARDLLGNKEQQTFVAESTTRVDFSVADSTAPAAPINLRAGDANPSPWQKFRTFSVAWQQPQDPSGIARALFKLGTPPVSSFDTTASTKGVPPVSIRASQENGQMLYIWLVDGAGNTDHHNTAAVLLRYDATVPIIDSLNLVDSFGHHKQWFSPLVAPHQAVLKTFYREKSLARIHLEPSTLFTAQDIFPPVSGNSADFNLFFKDFPDGHIDFTVTVYDSAGNQVQAAKRLSLDATPPQNTVAQSPDSTAPGEFLVTWDPKTVIEQGSGLSGEYDIRLQVDNGPWNVWKSHFSGTNIVYTGFENHQYAFEVAAYDVAGNWEGFVGTAETITRVVAQLSDREAPPAPTQIMINGKSIPVWSSAADFSISWSQPPDASGIAKVYYKFNTPPQHDTDFDGSESGNPPLNVKAPQQGLIPLYLWLEDGVGNKNIKNIALTFLKFDSDPPEIRQLTVANAVYDSKWLNSDSTTHAQVRLLYSEIHPDSLRYSETLNASPIIEKNQLVGGLEEQIDLLIPIQERNDGCHRFICTLIDSAGNKAIDSLQICLDHTPPVGATATSPQNSTSGRFTVTWADENAGTDPDGSGISGEYDLRLRVGDGSWFEVLNRTTATSFTYVGVHGNAFSFEVAAWDHVGNRELFTGVPETTTIVDTSFVDDAAPSAPLALSVQGRNPSAWQRDPDFEVQWSNPPDPSGISYAYYKFYQPPQNPTDFVDSIAVDHEKGRLVVQTHEEGANILYLWLKDGRGNCNYLNHASIMLRYDATPPIIESISWDQSADSKNWLNQLKTPSIPFQLVFIEDHLDSFTVWNKTVGFYRFDRPQQVARNDTLPFSLDLSRASDGDLTLSAVLQDSAGNKSLPDSVLMHLDSKPPVVTLVSEDSIIMGAEPFRVQVQVVDSNSLAGVNLLYSEGGKRNRSMIPMKETSASHYEATIPESLISARGLEIAILAADSVNQTRYPNEKQVRAIRVRVEGDAQRGLVMPSPLPSGSEENSYRMIAFPLEIDKSSPKDVLTDDIGPYDQQLWRFFYWDAAAPSYQEFNDIVLMNPGQAFWMITTKPEITIDTGPGITVNTTKSFFIILKKGWNDIAVPFNFAVDWKDIISSSAIDTQKIQGPHAYEGRWIYPFENSILQPWQGYSVYSEVDDYSLRMPALEAKSQLSKAAAFGNGSGFEWAMKLCVTSGKAEDAANYFGCAKAATDKWDYGLDYIEAPQVGSYISLYFPHEDWVSSARRFATDIRSSKRGNIWDFEIATNKPDDNVKLTFSPVKNLPKSLALRMVDNEAGVAIDIAADSVYTFKFSKEETIRHFTLYAGDNHFIEEHQEELPATPSEFELVQNYPNPFNSSTIISYRLENATNVNLAVYNLLAQKVRQLQSGHREKGFYQISWNARDDHDIELGTGVYILRLETPEFTSTRKMVYMR